MAGTIAQDAAPVADDPSAFFLAFAAALQRQSTYPDGHPLLRQAVARVHEQMDALLAGRDAVLVGVTPERLLIDDAPLANDGPSTRELARRLHRRDVGAIRLTPGADVDELGALLRAIARRDERDDQTAPGNSRQVALPHVQLFPLQFGGLALAEPEADEPTLAGDGNLWEQLVHLAVGPHDPAGDHASEQVALTLRERLREPLLEVECANEITALLAGAATGASLRGRAGAVIAVLEPADLHRVIAAQPDHAAGRALVAQGARALPASGVLALTRAAAAAGVLSASDATMVLMEKLTTLASATSGRGRGRADAALRRHVADMVSAAEADSGPGTTVEDPAASLGPLLASDQWARPTAPSPSWAERLVRLGVEVDALVPVVLTAIDTLAIRDDAVLVAIGDAAAPDNSVGAHIRAGAFTEVALTSMLTSGTVGDVALTQVATALGPQAVGPLVDSLMAAPSRRERYRLGRILAQCGEAAAEAVAARMAGAARPVLRTALAYLTHVRSIPAATPISRYARHPDAGVRAAAVRLLLTTADTREAAAVDALAADDPHLRRLAARYFASHGAPEPVIAPLVAIVRDQTQPSALRALAVRAVQGSRDPAVFDALLEVATTRARLTRRARLAPLTPHVVAALHVLARGWSDDGRVREVLDLALEVGALTPVRRSASAVAAGLTATTAAPGGRHE